MDREPLSSMAYASLTFVTKVLFRGDEDAAKSLGISGNVFKALGTLASRKGERKYPSAGPYSDNEKEWVLTVTRLLIRRVGEKAAGLSTLPEITMAMLPRLD